MHQNTKGNLVFCLVLSNCTWLGSSTPAQTPTLHSSTSISLPASPLTISYFHSRSHNSLITDSHKSWMSHPYNLQHRPSKKTLSNWEVYSKLTSQNLSIAPSLTSKKADWDSFNREAEEYFILLELISSCSTSESAKSIIPPQIITYPKARFKI